MNKEKYNKLIDKQQLRCNMFRKIKNFFEDNPKIQKSRFSGIMINPNESYMKSLNSLEIETLIEIVEIMSAIKNGKYTSVI